MSDRDFHQVNDRSDSLQESGPGAGALLRQAREARGATVEQVAAALKLRPRQVEAIEDERYETLGSATYVRGFVRSYARLVELDGDALLALLDRQALVAAPPALEVPAGEGVALPGSRPRKPWLMPVMALSLPVVVALGLAAYFDWFGPLTTMRPAVVPPVPAPMAEVPQPAAEPQAVPDAAQEPPPASVVAPADTALRHLKLSFAEDAWVEIKDADGRVIHSQLNRTGTTFDLEGKAPLMLVIGNAPNVRVTVDDQPLDLTPHTRISVARLTLD